VIERITVEVYTQALSQDDNRMVVQGSMAQRRTQPLRSASERVTSLTSRPWWAFVNFPLGRGSTRNR